MLIKEKTSFCWSATIFFAVIIAIGHYFHELWCDEAFSALILDAPADFKGLFAKIAFDGHPKLWYIIMYGAKTLLNPVAGLKVFTVIFISISLFIFFRSAPFSRIQKLLFAAGFYPLYQYGMNNRPYALLLIFLFLYAALRHQMYKKPLYSGIALAMLASVHVLSLIFSMIIVFAEFIHYRRKSEENISKTVWPAILIVLIAWALTIYQILPLDGAASVFVRDRNSFFFIKTFANGFFPNFHFLHRHLVFQTAAGLLLWSLSWFCFKGRPLGLLLYLVSTIALAVFFSFIYKGFRWHHGLYYIIFVVSLWIGIAVGEPLSRKIKAYIVVLFSIQAAMGFYAYAYDLVLPASSGFHAAEYIKKNGLENMNRVGIKIIRYNDGTEPRYSFDINQMQSTMVYLDDHKIYDPRLKDHVTYWAHYSEEHYFDIMNREQVVPELSRVANELGSDLLVIVLRPPMTDSFDMPQGIIKLKDLPAGLYYGESVSLYVFKKNR